MKIFPLALIALAITSRVFAVESSLAIDKTHSQIEAVVKSTTENFPAKLTAYDAIVALDPAGKHVASVQFKFRFADLSTGNEKRDVEMRQWEETGKFPDCEYVLVELLPVAGGTFNARGKFTLHGVTKEITFPVNIGFKDPVTCTIDGELAVDTRDYGLPVIRKYAVLKVNPVLQVKFHLEGHVPPGA